VCAAGSGGEGEVLRSVESKHLVDQVELWEGEVRRGDVCGACVCVWVCV